MVVALRVYMVRFSFCPRVQVSAQQQISLGLEIAHFCEEEVKNILIVVGRFCMRDVNCTKVYIFFYATKFL